MQTRALVLAIDAAQKPQLFALLAVPMIGVARGPLPLQDVPVQQSILCSRAASSCYRCYAQLYVPTLTKTMD
jgi:hypothetical protein